MARVRVKPSVHAFLLAFWGVQRTKARVCEGANLSEFSARIDWRLSVDLLTSGSGVALEARFWAQNMGDIAFISLSHFVSPWR